MYIKIEGTISLNQTCFHLLGVRVRVIQPTSRSMAEALGDKAFLKLGSLLEGDEEILRSGTLLYLGLGLRLRIGWVRFRVRARVGTIAGIKTACLWI